MVVAVIVLVVLVGVLTVLLLRRSPAGARGVSPRTPPRARSNALEASGRQRGAETRMASSGLVRARPSSSPAPVTEEAIGVTRREFFNRALVLLVGFSLAGSGSAVLAFLWPSGTAAGFGGKIKVSGLKKILAGIQTNQAPFYVPAARTWLQHYPPSALPEARRVYKPVIYAGMQQGVVALYQRCPHLGCRVPWCQSSQWFECPCHGSKYNAVGEKKAGPAPRGMDRFPIVFDGDSITIDTSNVILGPPIGTNTTGQQAAGPLCV